MNGEATSECADAVEMMRPHFFAFMPGIAARIAWNADDRLIAMICVPLLDRKLLDRRDVLDAGVVHQDVEEPSVFSAVLIMAAISAGLVMSAGE